MDYRVQAFRKLRSLLKVFPGSRLVAEWKTEYRVVSPIWRLVDKRGAELASLTSVHVWQGIYNHFPKGFDV